MGQGAAGALALVLIWLAFVSFFVAFHPGGLTLANGSPAQNPRDVVLWLMQRAAGGSPETSVAGGTGTAPVQAE
jgi:hypothetical protein